MSQLEVLKHSNFTKLWLAQILSQIAGHMLNFALIIKVFELAEGSSLANFSVGLLVLSFGIPSVLFAAAAGVYVDNWPKKTVLVWANLLRFILVLGYLVFEHNLLLVLLLTFLISTVTQFFVPAESAAIPEIVPPKLLLTANSLFVFTIYASFVVGYSSSAIVLEVLGASGPYLLAAVMFLVAGAFSIGLPKLGLAEKQSVGLATLASVRSEITKNWSIIRSRRELSFPLLQLALAQALVFIILPLAPALSLALLQSPLQKSSHVLVIPAGIGMVVGVVLVGQLTRRWSKTGVIGVCMVVAGFSLMLLGLSGQLYRTPADIISIRVVVGGLVFVLGLMNSVISVSAQTLLQESTPAAIRGKVFGALNMLVNAAAILPLLLVGFLSDLLTVTRVLSVLGFVVGVYAVSQWWYFRRSRLGSA